MDEKNNLYQSEQQIHLLDQKALSMSLYNLRLTLTDELLNLNVYQLAQAKTFQSPGSHQRKNSDEDIYVEETLLFSYDPSSIAQQNSDGSSTPRKLSGNLASTQTLNTLIQQVETLRQNLLIEVHKWDEEEDIEYEKSLLQKMMSDEYVDEEIDKLLETLSATIKMNANNLSGDFIENDIRLSESIRDSLDEIKIMMRAPNNKSGILERRRFLQRYMEVAELLGVSLTVEHLLPALLEVFKQDDGQSDKDYIKLIFTNLKRMIDFLASSKITDGYNGIRDYIMSFFNHFFQSEKVEETIKQELLQDAISLLVDVSKIMTNEDRAEKVLPIILENIRDDSDEERRILGLELVDRLAEQMGREICQSFLMYEIVSLQDDPIYRVRKETVMRMINISKVLGKEIFLGILFPVFKKLANDQIWGVRRSAVEQLPQISNLCPIEIKNGILIEMFKKFSQDSSKWVKMATFQFLGPFIASYEGIDPNPLLVEYYITMCEQNKSPQPDNEVPYHCAYNFPAVLQTLGPKSWEKLQPVHDQLVKDSRWKVRRTLAFSLHEIAKILGPEITERELMPVLNLFLRDQIEVREGVSENLPKFIQVLKPEQRETYIDKLAQTSVDVTQWRKRVIQATQIRKFSKIFSADNVNKYYVPIFFLLCQDQVAEVRVEAAKAIKNISRKLQDNEELLNQFINKVILLKQSNKYSLRQTFIQICESMMENKGMFQKYLLKDFCDLQRDRIINVRMVLSETLANHFLTHENGGLVQEIRELRVMIKHLKLDTRDVSDIIAEVTVEMQEGDEIDEIKQQEQEIEKQKDIEQELMLSSSVLTQETLATNNDESQQTQLQDESNTNQAQEQELNDSKQDDAKVESQIDQVESNQVVAIDEETKKENELPNNINENDALEQVQTEEQKLDENDIAQNNDDANPSHQDNDKQEEGVEVQVETDQKAEQSNEVSEQEPEKLQEPLENNFQSEQTKENETNEEKITQEEEQIIEHEENPLIKEDTTHQQQEQEVILQNDEVQVEVAVQDEQEVITSILNDIIERVAEQ